MQYYSFRLSAERCDRRWPWRCTAKSLLEGRIRRGLPRCLLCLLGRDSDAGHSRRLERLGDSRRDGLRVNAREQLHHRIVHRSKDRLLLRLTFVRLFDQRFERLTNPREPFQVLDARISARIWSPGVYRRRVLLEVGHKRARVG